MKKHELSLSDFDAHLEQIYAAHRYGKVKPTPAMYGVGHRRPERQSTRVADVVIFLLCIAAVVVAWFIN